MSNFYKLRVAEIRRETEDAVSVAFNIDDEFKSAFNYQPGQYLTLKFLINGVEERRSYSLCSSPFQDELMRVAVKKVENGKVSTYINEHLNEGDEVEVMAPQGNFVLDINENNEKLYVAFASGSGITPILSMINSVLIKENNSRFVLFYGNRSPEQTIFKSQLDQLLGDRLTVQYIYSRTEGSDKLYTGRIDKEKANLLLRGDIDLLRAEGFYLCGPEEMILNVSNCLKEFDVNKEKVFYELFTTPVLFAEKENVQKDDSDFSGQAKIKVICDDEEVEFDLDSDGDVILDAAIEYDLDLPFSCKGGVCCTCKAKVVEGKVTMDANYALSDAEVEEGFVLTCQAHPASSYVVVDYD
jgi:ring-1,2-phenylacetyl-CoA epoxidase subunit PaaE